MLAISLKISNQYTITNQLVQYKNEKRKTLINNTEKVKLKIYKT